MANLSEIRTGLHDVVFTLISEVHQGCLMGQYCDHSTDSSISTFFLIKFEENNSLFSLSARVSDGFDSDSDIFLICILLIVTLIDLESESDIKPRCARVSDGAVL